MNILALAWTLRLPAKSLKGRSHNHLRTMEFKEEILLEDDDFDGGDVDFDEGTDDEEDDDLDKVTEDEDGEAEEGF